jgi:hypothetical protein
MKRFPLVLMSIFALASPAFAGPPSIRVTVTPTHVTNQGDEAIFTFTLSAPATRRIAVSFFLSGGADLGSDYVLVGNFNKSGQLVIPVGQTSAMVTLHTFEEDIENDGQPEFAALDIVDGPRYRVGSPSQAVVRIQNFN